MPVAMLHLTPAHPWRKFSRELLTNACGVAAFLSILMAGYTSGVLGLILSTGKTLRYCLIPVTQGCSEF